MKNMEFSDTALTVRRAYMKYGSNVILKGLNMTVPKGCIYGLLGPSGCGKTTLFKCIVGRQELDSGEIVVKANRKQDIGYMPQELALYKEFSIQETLLYYGMLYGKSKQEVFKRMQKLTKILELPASHYVVGNLSGGQKRRVSFCVALLHDPQLLILDEPTVGVDPVLSHNIWEHLIHLTKKERKAIVITTHYIEEARQANVIGMMREGVLLAEESPTKLMEVHHCDNLEQAFLSLSYSQATSLDAGEVQESYPKSKVKYKPPLDECSKVESFRVKAQTMKTIFWMKRNIGIMLFIIILPVVQVTLFNVCIGRDPKGLRLGFVNRESSRGLSACDRVSLLGCHIDSHLSCRYLDILRNKSIELIEYETFEEGEAAVRRNDAWGLLYFDSNFTNYFVTRLNLSMEASDEVFDNSEVNIWMDMSDQYIGNLLKRDLYLGFVSFQKGLFQDCGWPVQLSDIPIHFEEAIFGSNDPIFVHFTSPAIVTIVQFYTPMLFTVAAILMEKMQGLLERNLVAGLNLHELLISHSIIQGVLLVVNTIIISYVNFYIFDNPMIGSIPIFVSLLLLIGVMGMNYGILIAVYSQSDIEATIIGLGTFFPLAILSGMVWPKEGMHSALKSVSWLLPLTLPTDSYRAVAARNWDLSHPEVYNGFFSCLGWIAFFFGLAGLVIKWRKGLTPKR